MKKRRKHRRFICNLLTCFFAALFVFSAYMLYKELQPRIAAKKQYEQLAQRAIQPEMKNPICFAYLMERNKDTVAWIQIEDSNINYPIVQGEDNNFYLYNGFDKKTGSGGSIFMDWQNNSSFKDKNTILFGHHMKDGSMFNNLKYFKEQDFAQQHTITIYTPDYIRSYTVFAVCNIKANENYLQISFDKEASFLRYCQKMILRSTIQTNIRLKRTDSILTLSTCDYTQENDRLVIFARLSSCVKVLSH